MAKSKLNPIFTKINNHMGNIVFYKRRGIQCLRKYVIPRNPDTEAQRANRHTFRDAVKSWKELPGSEKDIYNRKVLKMKTSMSGYSLYISEYMKRNAVNDTRIDTVLVQERSRHDTDPLRSSSVSTPFLIEGKDYTAYTWTGHSPGRDA